MTTATHFLDLLSGIGVSALGYGHPAIEQAIAHQSTRLLHTSNLFFHEGTANLALRLTEISGMDRVFFCNSGTEAWEAALKLARAYATKARESGKRIGTKFLALEHSFHGRTMGSVATTHKDKYRLPFAPVMGDVEFVRFNDVADLRAKFSDDVCGICIEPVQGEGGIHPVSQEFFAAARELCDSTGALLLADEIQSGLGRTGKWFAYQHYGIQPDVTTLAKPIAGGIPMGAMLCTETRGFGFHSRHARHDLWRRSAGLRRGDRGHRYDATREYARTHRRGRRILQGRAERSASSDMTASPRYAAWD